MIVAALLAIRLVRGTLAGSSAQRARFHLLRLHFALVAFAAVVFFAHEQIPDLVRRWTPLTLIITTALAFGFALVVWATTRRLLTLRLATPAQRTKETSGGSSSSSSRSSARWRSRSSGSTSCSTATGDPGWGLAVLAAILGAAALAGSVVDADDPPQVDPRPLVVGRQPRLPRVLASCVAIAFALGVFDASFGYAVYVHDLAWQALIIPQASSPGWGSGGSSTAGRCSRGRRRVASSARSSSSSFAAISCSRSSSCSRRSCSPSSLAAVRRARDGREADAALARGDRRHHRGRRRGAGDQRRSRWKPVWFGAHLGAVGVLFSFLLTSALVVSLIAWGTPAIPVPRLFRALNAKAFRSSRSCSSGSCSRRTSTRAATTTRA